MAESGHLVAESGQPTPRWRRPIPVRTNVCRARKGCARFVQTSAATRSTQRNVFTVPCPQRSVLVALSNAPHPASPLRGVQAAPCYVPAELPSFRGRVDRRRIRSVRFEFTDRRMGGPRLSRDDRHRATRVAGRRGRRRWVGFAPVVGSARSTLIPYSVITFGIHSVGVII